MIGPARATGRRSESGGGRTSGRSTWCGCSGSRGRSRRSWMRVRGHRLDRLPGSWWRRWRASWASEQGSSRRRGDALISIRAADTCRGPRPEAESRSTPRRRARWPLACKHARGGDAAVRYVAPSMSMPRARTGREPFAGVPLMLGIILRQAELRRVVVPRHAHDRPTCAARGRVSGSRALLGPVDEVVIKSDREKRRRC